VEAEEVKIGGKRPSKTREEPWRGSNRRRILYKEDKNEKGGDVLCANRSGKTEDQYHRGTTHTETALINS